jgi:hypothetical protein
MLALRPAADLSTSPVVPLGIRTTPGRDVLSEADPMAAHAASRGNAGSLQVRTTFLGGHCRLRCTQTNAVVGAHLTLGPDVPLGKLLVQIGRWAVHHSKG